MEKHRKKAVDDGSTALIFTYKLLFFADLMLANSYTSNSCVNVKCALHRNRHGRSYEHAYIVYNNCGRLSIHILTKSGEII